jgi:hypothetical protein
MNLNRLSVAGMIVSLLFVGLVGCGGVMPTLSDECLGLAEDIQAKADEAQTAAEAGNTEAAEEAACELVALLDQFQGAECAALDQQTLDYIDQMEAELDCSAEN